MRDYNTNPDTSQEQKLFQKLAIKKAYNKQVIEYLRAVHEPDRADRVLHCGEHIGITTIDGIAKIVKADFCRERLCAVCAWRRQAKFTAQTFPILSILEQRGYEFIFVTLTIANMKYDKLEAAVDSLLCGYALLRHRRKIKRSWVGIIRSVEMTYNADSNTFHPHLHLLVAVPHEYFINRDLYITQGELADMWADCIGACYTPVCHIEKVKGDTTAAAVETIKYALKPTDAKQAFSAFFYILRGRRLISFCGIFAKLRRELKYSDFENILTDDVDTRRSITYNLYTFDATGGVYRFNNTYTLER